MSIPNYDTDSLTSSTHHLLKKFSKSSDKKALGEDVRQLTNLWAKVDVEQLISEGASANVLQGFIRHIDQMDSRELNPLRARLFHVEKVVRNNMYGAVTAETHLEKLLGTDYSKYSFASEIESFYDSFKSDEIDLKLLFNIFADEWGRGRATHKGMELEGDEPFRFLNLYERMCQIYSSIPGSVDRQQLEIDYSSVKDLRSQIIKIRTPKELTNLCVGIENQLKNLKAGQSMFIPGGWSGYPNQGQGMPKVDGHSMMYQVFKIDDTYSIRVYNSGAGLNYHQISDVPDKHNPAVEWYGLTEETATDSVFWQKILEAQVIPNVLKFTEKRQKYDSNFIYLEFQKHLKIDCLQPRAAIELADLKDQRGGTCSRKAPDMVGRARLIAKDFKRLRLEEKVVGLGLLQQLIKKGNLSLSDQKMAKELYVKTLPKIWVALSKYHQEFETDSLSSTAYLISTLKALEKEEWNKALTSEVSQEVVDKPIPARLVVETLREIQRTIRIMAKDETPLLHMTTVGSGGEIRLDKGFSIQQFMTSLDATVKRLSQNMNHIEPLDLLSQLQSEVFEHLPPPAGEGVAFWKQTVNLTDLDLESFLKNLQTAVNMNYQASHQLEQILPQTTLNAWKTYAAVTYVLRNRAELSELVKQTPVSWAHFNSIYDHPLFSQFTGDFAVEARAIREFFEQDSPKGNKLTGKDLSEVKTVPLFDYSWEKVSIADREKIPEVCCRENYIEEHKNNSGYDRGEGLYKCMCAWSQIAQFAEHSIWEEFNPRKANLSSYQINNYKPLDTQFHGTNAWIENKTTTGPIDLNLQHSLWKPSKQTEPFLKRLWGKESLEQSGVIKELNQQGKLASEFSYHMDMISSSPANLKLHLLLSYFEDHPSKLLEKDILDYFMAHLHAGRFLIDTIEKEPAFLNRLLIFLDRLADEDAEKPHNDLALQRMLQVLYTLCKIHQVIPDNQVNSAALEKMRDQLAKMPLTDPEKISQRARYMLASYSLAPPSQLNIERYFHYIFQNKQEEIKGGFEAFIALEASRFHLTVLPEILHAMQDDKSRSTLLSFILQPSEEGLLTRPTGSMTVTEELKTLQNNLVAEWAKWNKNSIELEEKKRRRDGVINEIRAKQTQTPTYQSSGRSDEHILKVPREVGHDEAPLDLTKLNHKDKDLIEFYDRNIEILEKSLPTTEQKLESARKLSDLLEDLPEKWCFVGNILLIKDQGTILEIDLSLGRIYRNGLTINKGRLPISIQQSKKCAPFGKGLKASAIQKGSSFIIQKNGFEHVTFKSNISQDVILKIDKKNYFLLDAEAMKGLKLPECLQEKSKTCWMDPKSYSGEILLCIHDEAGRPIPSFSVSNDGSIYRYGHPELFLFKSVPEDVIKTFKGLGINANNAICWMDHQGYTKRIDLPLKDQNSGLISFEKKNGDWYLESDPSFRVGQNQYVPELGIDDFHLVLENQEGHKIVQLPYNEFEQFYTASEGKKASGSSIEFPLVYSFQWTDQGLQSHQPGAKFLLMYRHIKNSNYKQALQLLESGVTPVGKPFSKEDLKFLQMIIMGKSSEQSEHHVEATVFRIVLTYRVKNYIKRWEKEEYTQEKLQKIHATSPAQANFIRDILSPSSNMGNLLRSYYQGASPSERLAIGSFLGPEEELDLLYTWVGIQNRHAMKRAIDLKKISPTQNPKTLIQQKQPKLASTERKKFDHKEFFQKSFWFDDLFRFKKDSIEDRWMTFDVEYSGLNFKQYYEILMDPSKDFETLRKKNSLIAKEKDYGLAGFLLELAEKVKEGAILPLLPKVNNDKFVADLKALFVDEEQKEKVCKELFQIEKSLQRDPLMTLPESFGKSPEVAKDHIKQAINQINNDLQELKGNRSASLKIEKECYAEFVEEQIVILQGLIKGIEKFRENNLFGNQFEYERKYKEPPTGLSVGGSYWHVVYRIFEGLKSKKPIEALAKEIATEENSVDSPFEMNKEAILKRKYEERAKVPSFDVVESCNRIANLIGYPPSLLQSDDQAQIIETLYTIRQTLLDISHHLTTPPEKVKELQFNEVFAPLLKFKEGVSNQQFSNFREIYYGALSKMSHFDPYSNMEYQDVLKIVSESLEKLEKSINQGNREEFFNEEEPGKFLAALCPILITGKLPNDKLIDMMSEAKMVLTDIERLLEQSKKWNKLLEEEKTSVTLQGHAERIMHEWSESKQPPTKKECYHFDLAQKELEKIGYTPFHNQVEKQWLNPCETYVNHEPLIDETTLKGLTDEEKKSLNPLLKGLEDYRMSRQKEQSVSLNPNYVQAIHLKTASELSHLTKKSGALEKSILDLANTLPANNTQSMLQTLREQGRHKHILNLKDCIHFALQDDVQVWKSHTHLNDEQVFELQAKIVAYLTMSTEIQHLQRGNTLLASALKSSDVELLGEIGSWITGKRSYKLKEDCIHHLVFEHYADMRMRKPQKDLIDQLSGLPIGPVAKGKVLQLIMGAGKSKVIGPILAIMAADGYHLSTFCFTSGLYGTGIADFSQTAWQRFGRISDTLQFSRGDCNTENLYRLVIHIQHAINARKVLLHRPKDLLSMRMMIDERDEQIYQFKMQMIATTEKWILKSNNNSHRQAIFDYVFNGKELDQVPLTEIQGLRQSWVEKGTVIQDYQTQIEILESILKLLNHRQDAQFDEWDTIADPKNQVSFPIGDPVQASSEGIDKACELYFQLLPKYEKQLRISKNGQTLAKEETRIEVQNGLAKDVWGLYRELLTPFKMTEQGFIAYLKNENTSTARQVYETLKTMSGSLSGIDRKLTEEIAFYKYALNGGLQTALQADGNVSYGRSKVDPTQELAIPYEDNDVPKEGTRFRAVWETALKSCQHYRQSWNQPDQTAKLLGFFLNQDALEGGNQQHFADIRALFGPIGEIDISNKERLTDYMKILRKGLKPQNPNHQATLRLIGHYLQHVVFQNQLKKDIVQITANPFDLVHIPGSSKGFSGTWAFGDTWSSKVEAISSPYTDALTIDALTEVDNRPCLIIDSNKNLVDQLAYNPAISAIIDAAPLFKGVNNARLARQLLDASKKSAIIYYHDDGLAIQKKDVKDPLFLTDSSKDTLKKALGDIPFEEVLTLYDRAHTVGSDIFQAKGSLAYVTIGDQLTKDRLLQAVMRMRFLILRGHNVKFVMTEEVAELIGKTLHKDPALIDSTDVIRYTKLVQDDKEIAANPFALRDEIRYHVKAAIRKAKAEAPNPSERQIIHEKYRSHLLQVQNLTLFEEYGSIDVEDKTIDILTKEMNHAIHLLEEIDPNGNKDFLIPLKARMETIPLPKMLKTSDSLSDATIEIEQSTDKDQQKDLDQLKDINLDYEGAGKTPIVQKQWPSNLEEKDLFQISTYGASRGQIPALYLLSDCHSSFANVFDDTLTASENWVKTFVDKENSLLTPDQRPIHHVLVVQEGEANPQMVLLTPEESDQWIDFLVKRKSTTLQERKIWLVEPGGDLVQSAVEPWKDPFANEAISKGLVQLLFMKGEVMKLSSDQVFPVLEDWAKSHQEKSQLRPLFESILSQQEENLTYYLSNKKLAKAIS